MKNLFNSIKMSKPNRNFFDLTHDVKLTCNLGELIPTCIVEAVPGDKFSLEGNALVKFAPLIAPVMHRLDCTIHYFFVPKRIMWDGWEKWIVGDADAEEHPYLTAPSTPTWNDYGTLADYLGIPPPGEINTPDQNEIVSAFPFMAYLKVWYEFYRDQNLVGLGSDLQELMDNGLTEGNQSALFTDELTQLRRRAWEHDYFTSALPFAQKGQAVSLPIGASVVEVVDPTVPGMVGTFRDSTSNSATTGDVENLAATGSTVAGQPAYYDPQGTLVTGATETTINELRRAYALQRWLEKNARGGSRYAEHILMHFGVKSSDARLQRPEYITGSKSPVMVSEVVSTVESTDATLPQGNMAGHAVSVNAGNYGSYFCEEHGYIIGIMNVQPKTAYSQGIAKHWQKIADPTQHYWSDFAHIGEQEVLKSELYAYKDHAEPTFGYIPRYAEYKYEPNRIAGDFRSTLNYWHFGRLFDPAPALNEEFIQCTPTNDPFAVIAGEPDHLYCHVLNKIGASRLMPKFGNPI